jgi:hypothetical protein
VAFNNASKELNELFLALFDWRTRSSSLSRIVFTSESEVFPIVDNLISIYLVVSLNEMIQLLADLWFKNLVNPGLIRLTQIYDIHTFAWVKIRLN